MVHAPLTVLRPAELDTEQCEGLDVGAVEVDGRGSVRSYNAAMSRLSGLAPGAVIGRHFFTEVAPGTDMPDFHGRFLRAVAGGAVDLSFPWVFTFGTAPQAVAIRIASIRAPDRFVILVEPHGPLMRPVEERRALALAQRRADRGDAEDGAGADHCDDNGRDPCVEEPIHLAAAIQPHGCLLALDLETMRVVTASANLVDFLAIDAERALGAHLSELLAPAILAPLIAALGCGPARSGPRLFEAAYALPGRPGRISAHIEDGRGIVEIEAAWTDAEHRVLDETARIIAQLAATDDEARLITIATAEIAALTGFHRVIFYRFDEDADGEVLDEVLTESTYEPLLGLRFPAGDIPPQARALYVRSRFRWMPNTDYVPVPLVPRRPLGTSRALDLGPARLRSQSPYHRIYQRNLGVAAGFSASVVIDGALHSMIVGHHQQPRFLSSGVRTAIELVGQVLEARLDAIVRRRASAAPGEHRALRRALVAGVREADDWADELVRSPGFLDLFGASGGVIVDGSRLTPVGRTPPAEVIDGLIAALRGRIVDGLLVTHHAAAQFPALAEHAATASGLLAVGLEAEGRSLLVWFRPEYVHHVNWGGPTAKQTLTDEFGERIRLPRSNFRRWVETRRGYAEPWPPWTAAATLELRVALGDALVGHSRTLRRINAELQALHAAQLAFFSTVNHELRTPLNGILGTTELLGRLPGGLSSEARGYVTALAGAAGSLERVINDVLDHTELAGGRLSLHATPFSLVALFAELRALTTAMLRPGGELEVEFAIDEGLGEVIGDRARVRQATMNLVVHALHSARAGTVRIRMARREPVGVTIEISDTGPGIPDTHLERVFEPYGAAGTPMAEGLPSSGLRLSLTRQIAREMGGALSVESVVDRGSCFRLELPLVSASPPAVGPDLAASGEAHGPLEVLVVDDNEINLLTLAAMLHEIGHTVETAMDGAEALGRVGARGFDLILMDKHMPIMGGEEALRLIRARTDEARTTPIYMVSADIPEVRDAGIERGFDGYLAKPIRSDELRAVIDATRPRSWRSPQP